MEIDLETKINKLKHEFDAEKDIIVKRRIWNQICIVALVAGIATDCYQHQEIFCLFLGVGEFGIKNKRQVITCQRCKHRREMETDPNQAFIGFEGI